MKDKSLEFALKSVEIEAAEVARVAEIVRTAEFGQAVDCLLYTSPSPRDCS